MIVDASGYSPPTPSPRMKRHATSWKYTSCIVLAGLQAPEPCISMGPVWMGTQLGTEKPAAADDAPRHPRMMSTAVMTNDHLRPKLRRGGVSGSGR